MILSEMREQERRLGIKHIRHVLDINAECCYVIFVCVLFRIVCVLYRDVCAFV